MPPEMPPEKLRFQYRRLTLRLKHAAFAGGICPTAWWEPRPATAELMRAYRISLRRLAPGLALIVAEWPEGQPLAPLTQADNIRFEFLLCVESPDFLLYTDPTTPPSLDLRDIGISSEEQSKPSAAWPTPSDRDPWAARVLLTIPGDWLARYLAQECAASNPLVLRLEPRAVYWRYYCALPAGIQATQIAIGQDPSPSPSRISFDAATSLGDPVARAFAARSSGRTVVALTSSAPIPLRSAAAPRLKLTLNGEQLPLDLPSPPLDSLLVPGLSANGEPVAFRMIDACAIPSSY